MLGFGLFLAAGCSSGAGSRGATGRAGSQAGVGLAASPSAGAGLAEDVALLQSPDFVRRSKAAERLVAAGSAALPLLGAAGELEVAGPGSRGESATRPVVAAILVGASTGEVEGLLASSAPLLRRAAAEELGHRPSWAPVPLLIERLEDSDAGVREAAHTALRRLTHEFVDAGAPSRASLVSPAERWRTWWRQEGRLKAAPAGSSAAG